MTENLYKQKLSENRLERNFTDYNPLYTKGEALCEANRCLFCYDAPCIKACPTAIDIPKFIKKISSDNVKGSARTIWESNMLGYSCGRVCPVSELCVGACVYNDWNGLPIEIGRLQRYATETVLDWEQKANRRLLEPKPKGSRKVALIGAGPASLSCAAVLALEGVHPVIFEKRELPGGLNTTGIAPYKMASEDSLREVQWLLNFGVDLRCGVEVGKDISHQELLEDYDAVFLGVGLGKDRFPGIPGELGPGAYGATQLIEKIKNSNSFSIPEHVKRVVVVGGGNTAIDIARELAMLGVEEVSMAYRRTRAEMSGYRFELKNAAHAGVRFLERHTPIEVLRNGERIAGLRTSKDGETVDLPCDWVVFAIGQSKRSVALFDGVNLNEKGCVVVNQSTYQTDNPKIYAGGDCINGGKEVVNAVAHGRDAARAMIASFQED